MTDFLVKFKLACDANFIHNVAATIFLLFFEDSGLVKM